MGKRSSFERVERDYYPTPYQAVIPLFYHLPETYTFIEPCAGDGRLVDHLSDRGGSCIHSSDIEPRRDDISQINCFDVDITIDTDYCITNPPWDRKILHPMIEYYSDKVPTWFLFDADWVHTKQSIPYIPRLRKIVSVGRVKWIEGSKTSGKDNVAWHLFDTPSDEPTQFFGRV